MTGIEWDNWWNLTRARDREQFRNASRIIGFDLQTNPSCSDFGTRTKQLWDWNMKWGSFRANCRRPPHFMMKRERARHSLLEEDTIPFQWGVWPRFYLALLEGQCRRRRSKSLLVVEDESPFSCLHRGFAFVRQILKFGHNLVLACLSCHGGEFFVSSFEPCTHGLIFNWKCQSN